MYVYGCRSASIDVTAMSPRSTPLSSEIYIYPHAHTNYMYVCIWVQISLHRRDGDEPSQYAFVK